MASAPRNTTILVVDDDRDIRDALVGLLELAGYRALEAEHGQQALDIIERRKLDAPGAHSAVLLDLMMPVMDGWRLMETLRRRGSLLPVIGLSASNREPPEGLLAFFKKPVEFDSLASTLAAHFD